MRHSFFSAIIVNHFGHPFSSVHVTSVHVTNSNQQNIGLVISKFRSYLQKAPSNNVTRRIFFSMYASGKVPNPSAECSRRLGVHTCLAPKVLVNVVPRFPWKDVRMQALHLLYIARDQYQPNSHSIIMAPQMKGLTQFIVDLRNSKDIEEERKRINLEINHIHSKFSTSSLNSYQKKKYVCKLIYIYLLGFSEETHFGIAQGYALAKSSDFLEKQLGYLLISILFRRNAANTLAYIENLFEETHIQLSHDLKIDAEDVNCLALQFIASNFNVEVSSGVSGTITDFRQQWEDLTDLVYGFCGSPVSSPNIRKKAAITLMVMIKVNPQVIITNDNWVPRLLSLLDDPDPSVALSAIPLTKLLTDAKPQYIKSIIPSIANRLEKLVISRTCPKEYLFYDIPAPWLVTRLLQLLEHFLLPPENQKKFVLSVDMLDSETLAKLRSVISKCIQTGTNSNTDQPSRNSQSSILFQAVAFTTLLDASSSAIDGAANALVSLLKFPDTNLRYLVLDALIKLSARSNPKASFREHTEKIFASLHDKDISIRRKAADLLYTMCDSLNYTHIVAKFLDYLPNCDSTLRGEISVRIAVIAEKYATDSMWYVSTMLRLLSSSGSTHTNGDSDPVREIWERITQIIVNNEDLQKTAARHVINSLKKPQGVMLDSLFKVAAFVLGEFGHRLLEDEELKSNFSPKSQFETLIEAYFRSSLSTRPLLLNAFVKFVVKFPNEDFVPDILDLFDAESQSLDLEIQTRAHEYLKIATWMVSQDPSSMELAKSIVREIPPFTSKRSKLLNHLGSVKHISERSSSTVNVLKIPKQIPAEDRNDASRDRKDLSMVTEDEVDPFHDPTPEIPQLSPNWYAGYHRMLHFDAGIFYEDLLVKLTYRIVKNGPSLQIAFTVINNAAKTADANITAFTVQEVHNLSTHENPRYIINLVRPPELTISQKTTMDLDVKVRDILQTSECPIVSITYNCSGAFNRLNLKIPVVLIKTLSGTNLSSLEEFRKRWLQIGEHLNQNQGEKRGTIVTNYRYQSSNMARTLQRVGFAIVHATPDSPGGGVLIMGAGILRTAASNYGLLMTIKSTDLAGRLFDLTIRSTGEGILSIIFDTLKEILQAK